VYCGPAHRTYARALRLARTKSCSAAQKGEANCSSLARARSALRRSSTILPHGGEFAFRKENAITALPVKIPHPERALGLLRLASAPRSPVVEAFAQHVGGSFRNLRHPIQRHERAVILGA